MVVIVLCVIDGARSCHIRGADGRVRGEREASPRHHAAYEGRILNGGIRILNTPRRGLDGAGHGEELARTGRADPDVASVDPR